ISGLKKDKLDYKGFIFFGLIKVNNDPYVIEYNCRMGDPETEVVLPRIQNDLVELLQATAKVQLNAVQLQKDKRFATTIVTVSGSYPDDYQKGIEITELPKPKEDSMVFY